MCSSDLSLRQIAWSKSFRMLISLQLEKKFDGLADALEICSTVPLIEVRVKSASVDSFLLNLNIFFILVRLQQLIW